MRCCNTFDPYDSAVFLAGNDFYQTVVKVMLEVADFVELSLYLTGLSCS